MRTIQNRIQEQWAFLPAAAANTRLAIFVHGFRGSYLGTWGRLSDMLAEHADTHAPFADWDYLFIGYDTGNVETYLDIGRLICGEWRKAARGEAPFKRAYDKVALFGHSLGTLAIRQVLCAKSIQPDGMIGQLHSVTLFGTPINGSPWANLGLLWPIAAALKPNNPQLRMLKQWTEDAASYHPWPPAKVVLGLDDAVAAQSWGDFLTWPGDIAPVERMNFNHSDLVKPAAWDQSHIVDTIRNALQ